MEQWDWLLWTALFAVGFAAGGLGVLWRERERAAQVRHQLTWAKNLRAGLEDQRKTLMEAERVYRRHLPVMHDMAMSLNRVDGVCSCEDCRRWRAEKEDSRDNEPGGVGVD